MADTPLEALRIEASLTALRAVDAVVSAVAALSRAQLPRVESAAGEADEYLRWLDRVVDRLAGPPRDDPSVDKLTVVFGPERALCGDLAQRVLDAVPADGELALVGSRLGELAAGAGTGAGSGAGAGAMTGSGSGAGEVAARGVGARAPRFVVPAAASVDELGPATERLAAALLADGLGERRVELLHPSPTHRAPHVTLLLPTRRGARARLPDLFSPPERVAEVAAREAVVGHLRAALTVTLLAETRARVVAADRARRAADEREAELAGALRVLQREATTNEVVELAAASEVDPRR